MSSIRAKVQGGRLLVDVPTDLPEGLVVTLASVDDDLSAEERAALERSIEESYVELERGESLDARVVIDELRRAR